MISFPNAKVNLGLNVLSKRADGYHNIESCFYPIPWCDVLEILPANSYSFKSTGKAIKGNPSHNLCTKAFSIIEKNHQIEPVSIHLHKVIPMGAGLGGGSADGAFTLKMLNELFKLDLNEDQLEQYAAQLGSDCPFFIRNEPILATERGTTLHPITCNLKGLWIVLIHPDIHVSTQEAYDGIVPNSPERSVKEIIEHSGRKQWRSHLKNDFEDSVFSKYPEIETIKSRLYAHDAIFASMSGSGSCVYGLFDNKPPHLKGSITFQL